MSVFFIVILSFLLQKKHDVLNKFYMLHFQEQLEWTTNYICI